METKIKYDFLLRGIRFVTPHSIFIIEEENFDKFKEVYDNAVIEYRRLPDDLKEAKEYAKAAL